MSLRYHYKSTQLTARYLTIACGFLFVLYSVLYIGIYQVDILALSHYLLSSEGSSYHVGTATFISCFLLSLLGVLVSFFFTFPVRFKAVAWLPSFVFLGYLSSLEISPGKAFQFHFPVLSFILCLIVSIALIILCQFVKDNRAEHGGIFNYIPSNAVVLIVGVFFTNVIANTDTLLHQQLRQERYFSLGDYEDAMNASLCSCHQNNTTTALNAMCLAKKGTLAEDLFSVPGLCGSFSLIPDTCVVTRFNLTPHLFYRLIGAVPAPGSHFTSSEFFSKALERSNARMLDSTFTSEDTISRRVLIDYYLCSLLLEKKVTVFCKTIPHYYTIDNTLPRHYREAMILNQRHRQTALLMDDGQPVPALEDKATEENFNDFINMYQRNGRNADEQRKVCTDMYGETYWSYFFFQKDP